MKLGLTFLNFSLEDYHHFLNCLVKLNLRLLIVFHGLVQVFPDKILQRWGYQEREREQIELIGFTWTTSTKQCSLATLIQLQTSLKKFGSHSYLHMCYCLLGRPHPWVTQLSNAASTEHFFEVVIHGCKAKLK
jgi:hypothetical protein